MESIDLPTLKKDDVVNLPDDKLKDLLKFYENANDSLKKNLYDLLTDQDDDWESQNIHPWIVKKIECEIALKILRTEDESRIDLPKLFSL
jgi:hypothetical protein